MSWPAQFFPKGKAVVEKSNYNQGCCHICVKKIHSSHSQTLRAGMGFSNQVGSICPMQPSLQ